MLPALIKQGTFFFLLLAFILLYLNLLYLFNQQLAMPCMGNA